MARYRRHRTDFHTHPRTAVLSPLERDLMWQAIESGGLLGVMERSVEKMARVARGNTTPADVREALGHLTSGDRPHAVWWDDLEVLWVIEAADEQCANSKTWKGAKAQAHDLPIPVRNRLLKRYSELRDEEESEAEYSKPKKIDEGPTDPDPASAPSPVSDPAKGHVPDRPVIRIVDKTDDPIRDVLNESLAVSLTAEQHGRFYTSAAERVADGEVDPDLIRDVIRKWQVDDKEKRPPRHKLFYHDQWPWTRKRYLDPPTESHGEATHRDDGIKQEPMSPEAVAEITRHLTERFTRREDD